MRFKKTSKNTFYCFSPPVMLATFIIEIACALWVIWRYPFKLTTRLSIAMLVCLAIFQMAEYNICEGAFGVDSLTWARIGHVAITLLPPLGIHMMTLIAKDKRRRHVVLSYSFAALFAGIYAFSGHGMEAQQCLGNYVIFSIASYAMPLYAAYYYGLLLYGLGYVAKRYKKSNVRTRRALLGMAIGYTAFILPTTIANVLDPSTIAGIPSIMCGFAVLYALTITFWVLPSAQSKLKKRTK